MFDPVRTKDVAKRLGRNYGTVKTHLHLAGKQEFLEREVARWHVNYHCGVTQLGQSTRGFNVASSYIYREMPIVIFAIGGGFAENHSVRH